MAKEFGTAEFPGITADTYTTLAQEAASEALAMQDSAKQRSAVTVFSQAREALQPVENEIANTNNILPNLGVIATVGNGIWG